MGLGDDIMSTAEVRAAVVCGQAKAVFSTDLRNFHWSPIFENHPQILHPQNDHTKYVVNIPNVPGLRPYIDYENSDPEHFEFLDQYTANKYVGNIYLTLDEIDFRKCLPPGDFIMVEPNVKGTVSDKNKDWGFDKWQAVVDQLGDYQIVQCSQEGQRHLLGDNVTHIRTDNVRLAISVLHRSSLFVGTDGALHHAAAINNVPAVVVWGGYSSPKHLGYDYQTNIRYDDSKPCGKFAACDHCRDMMNSVTTEQIAEATIDAYRSVHSSAA